PDISYSLGTPNGQGTNAALDLQVEPGNSHTVAFATGPLTFFFLTRVEVFDDAIQRPNGFFTSADSIQWSADGTTLFGADPFGLNCIVMAVDSNGVTSKVNFVGQFTDSTRVRFEPVTGFIYGNDGHVVNPANGAVVGSYAVAAAPTNLV